MRAGQASAGMYERLRAWCRSYFKGARVPAEPWSLIGSSKNLGVMQRIRVCLVADRVDPSLYPLFSYLRNKFSATAFSSQFPRQLKPGTH